jgi:hypothetical protein
MKSFIAPLGSGYLFLEDSDVETLYLALSSNARPFIPGIHVPNDVLQAYGRLIVTFLHSKDDCLAGDKRELGWGVLTPHARGIRLRFREDTRRCRLNISLIRSIMKAEVWVSLIFETER